MTSTPISKIPVQPNSQPPEEEDPEVLAILKEMQQPENIKQIPQQIMQPQQPMYMPQMVSQPLTNITTVPHSSLPSWFRQDLVQKAIMAAIIAYFIFNLKYIEGLYEKIPFLEKLQSYDFAVRILLLALVLYLIMWKFNL